jgi:hypothetical protein
MRVATVRGEFIAMWHTSRGDRTLRGEEAALVSNAIDCMIDALMVHIDDDLEDSAAVCESGIAAYDVFSPSQRIGLLHDVAKHLLTETETALPLSAPLDATVAAIFIDIRDQVAIEIDFLSAQDDADEAPTWRQMVLAAYVAIFSPIEGDNRVWDAVCGELPDDSCEDIRQWENLVDPLADAILWDRDFEMAESFLDVDPGVSHQRRRLLGINEDYFTSVAPDPRPEEVFRLISRTRDIVRAKPR